MRLTQKIASVSNPSSFMSVSQDTFAELKSIDDNNLNFQFSFRLSLKSQNKSLQDYDRVVVTVKRKDQSFETGTKDSSFAPQYNQPKIQPSIAVKLLSGLQIVNDIKLKEQYVSRVEVPLASYIEDATKNQYAYTEMYSLVGQPQRTNRSNALKYRGDNTLLSNYSPSQLRSRRIESSQILERMNEDLCDITTPAADAAFSSITSEIDVDDPALRNDPVFSEKNNPLYFDIASFYLNDIASSPSESKDTWYDKRSVSKFLDYVDASCQVPIAITNKQQSLTVRFDLYKRGADVVQETLSTELYVYNHVEAYESITVPPIVRANKQPSFNLVDASYSLTISDPGNNNQIAGYQIYLKDVYEDGTVGDYRNTGFVARTVTTDTRYELYVSTPLSVVRVIPIDSQRRESSVFTDVVVGEGYDVIGNLTILASHFSDNKIRIEAVNISKKTLSVSLFKRDCTDNFDSMFSKISDVAVIRGQKMSSVVFEDSEVKLGRVYEYYVIADIDGYVESSNHAMIRNTTIIDPEQTINVEITSATTTLSDAGGMSASFQITTNVSPTENQKITDTLKSQLGELYEQFLNPVSNTASPLGQDAGVPQYKDLFLHEIIRTNLKTSEREVFQLVSDGVFEDNETTQKLSNVKPLDPRNTYRYQIFTYKKNPIELFKNFVARGTDTNGKEWFYSPYKWLNSSTRLGTLPSEDSQGNSIITPYELFTSEPYGQTATYELTATSQYRTLSQVIAQRIDRNTVKLTWDFWGTSRYNDKFIYDAFVVMKVVNGIRSFVGRTTKNFIFHDLSENDIGSLYYIVVPITPDYSIASSGYSNVLVVSPAGITSKIKSLSGISRLSSDTASSIDPARQSGTSTTGLETLISNTTSRRS